jgi:hypothetical protein
MTAPQTDVRPPEAGQDGVMEHRFAYPAVQEVRRSRWGQTELNAVPSASRQPQASLVSLAPPPAGR